MPQLRADFSIVHGHKLRLEFVLYRICRQDCMHTFGISNLINEADRKRPNHARQMDVHWEKRIPKGHTEGVHARVPAYAPRSYAVRVGVCVAEFDTSLSTTFYYFICTQKPILIIPLDNHTLLEP